MALTGPIVSFPFPDVLHLMEGLPYLILTTHHSPGPHALLHTPRTSPNETIPLEGLVILDMLRELSQWVARGRALSATEERHF